MQTSFVEEAGVALCRPLIMLGGQTSVAAGSGQLGSTHVKAGRKFSITGIVWCLECPGLG